jgi:hypothetical protein
MKKFNLKKGVACLTVFCLLAVCAVIGMVPAKTEAAAAANSGASVNATWGSKIIASVDTEANTMGFGSSQSFSGVNLNAGGISFIGYQGNTIANAAGGVAGAQTQFTGTAIYGSDILAGMNTQANAVGFRTFATAGNSAGVTSSFGSEVQFGSNVIANDFSLGGIHMLH